MKIVSLLTLLTLYVSLQLSHAQENTLPAFISDSLDAYIETTLKQWQIPGLALGIVKDGNVMVAKGYGVCELGKNDSVNENTLFMIGSNTKAFTGTALAMLEVDEKCSLNDKVVKWVPSFKMHDDWVTQQATLTDLLTHRLGFETFQGDFMYFDSDFSDDEMLDIIGQVEPLYDFRTQWGYCNEGYFVAGKAIESITGLKWNEFLRANVLTPLNMKRTTTTVEAMRNASNKTTGHSFIDFNLHTVPYGGLDLLGPAASISSSVNDMNHWTMALLDSGKFEGSVVLPQQAINRTRKPESIIGNGRHAYNKNLFKLYGLGWQLSDYAGTKMVSHTGGVHGYVTSVSLIPELELGIVVLTNTDQNWAYEALKWEIVDAFMDLPYRNYSRVWNTYFQGKFTKDSLAMKTLQDSVALKIKPQLALKHFEGSYTHTVYGHVELKATKRILTMTFEHHPSLTAKLEYLDNDRFLCTYSNPSQGITVFPFRIEGKKVKSFTLSVADQLEFTTYEFIKD